MRAIFVLFGATETADIVIYGGTSSGIIAAVQAHRMGKSVVLIEPSNHIGGLTTGGLGATDIGNKAVIGGLARDFYHRVWQHYQNDAAWNRETRKQYNARNPHYDPKDETMWMFEPHVAAQIYREMLAEAGVTPLVNERLDRTAWCEEKSPGGSNRSRWNRGARSRPRCLSMRLTKAI